MDYEKLIMKMLKRIKTEYTMKIVYQFLKGLLD